MATAMQVAHSSASSICQRAPASTALVVEYVCLFTKDLRRKQKRWQDGNLKFHTFNKRIMVYDCHGNFMGDTHWREDYGFGEGEEIELERGGVIVQVAECTGSRDQDLSELIDKRAQERAERQSAAIARRPPTLEDPSTINAVAPHFQLRHKPLHHLIGTPTGHHGRALMPTGSPYEERQKLAASPENNHDRPAKRRKREASPPSKGGYAQSLFGAALTLSGTPASTPSARSKPMRPSSVVIDGQYATESLGPLILTHTTASRTEKDSRLNRPKQPGIGRRKAVGGHDMRKNSPQPLPPPEDLNSRDLKSDQFETGTESNVRHNVTSPTSLENRGKAGSTEPKLRKNTGILGDNEGRRELLQENFISEPRTELRIKPRKKRGLLMVTSKLDADKSSSKAIESLFDRHSSPSDIARRSSNSDILSGDKPSDNGTEEVNRPRQKKQIGANSSNKARNAQHSVHRSQSIENEDRCSPTPLDINQSQNQSTRIQRGMTKCGSKMAPEPTREDAILTEDIGGTGNRKQPPRKKKGMRSETSRSIYLAEAEYDEKRYSSDEDEFGLPDGVPTTRLAHLGRKSIRSKEVIGFIFDEEIDDSSGNALRGERSVDGYGKRGRMDESSKDDSEVQRTTMGAMRANHANTITSNQANITDKIQDTFPVDEAGIANENDTIKSIDSHNTEASRMETNPCVPQKQPRSESIGRSEKPEMQALAPESNAVVRLPPAKAVINPATRGKKAAKPSDAAGQVPQCPLPAEAAVGKPLDLEKHESHKRASRLENRRRETATAPMPGFARANGGPWSREAHDLFEFTRPS